MLKKLLLLVVGLTLGMSLFAETIRVAVLPAIDRENEVHKAYKFSIFQYIVTGITLVDGYEAYDRVNLATVLDEHKFQRDGMVNPDEIKKIGQMTGSQYVLIIEVMLFPKDPDVILVSAQFEDVETAHIQQKATARIHVDNDEQMEEECKTLAKKLLGIDGNRRPSSSGRSNSSSSVQTSGFVDMGLSVKWATCNVGASSPEGYGSLLTFDELSAVSNASRRVPTDAEWTELRVNCSWEWTTMNGVNGMKVTSSYTGNSIFLPAAGCRSTNGSLGSQGSNGNYWSSTANDSSYAWYVDFGSGCVYRNDLNRSFGFSVRPVTGY